MTTKHSPKKITKDRAVQDDVAGNSAMVSPLPSLIIQAQKAPILRTGSDPNIALAASDTGSCSSKVTFRNINKRLRRDGSDDDENAPINAPLSDMMAIIMEQNVKMEKMLNAMNEIRDQNNAIKASVEFMSAKYDELLVQVDTLTEGRKADRKYVQLLENRIETLERNIRETCLEIRNVPQKKGETNKDLLNIVKNTCDFLKVPMQNPDIKNIHRINIQTDGNKTILAEFTNTYIKEKILTAVKKYNKDNKTNKLNTSALKLEGPPKPLYVSECLTSKGRKLFALARELARSHEYDFCWTNHGIVYLRKTDSDPAIRISDEIDLDKLRI